MKTFLLFYLADGKTVDATQEMLALGACNLISSFVGSMPISGALSRGAVNNASGVKTTFGGVYTGNTSLSVAISSTIWLDLYLYILYIILCAESSYVKNRTLNSRVNTRNPTKHLF